jgi:prevent-host-death family protein
MAKTYTFTKARQNLKSVLDQAEKDGEVRITRRGGKTFVVRVEKSKRSPLDIPGVDTNISLDDIIEAVREGREYDTRERRGSNPEK